MQKFLEVFTETIDWADGEDPQYRTFLPLTKSEATDLASHVGPVSDAMLNGLGIGRRSLRHDWPKGQPPVSHWGIGVSVGIWG